MDQRAAQIQALRQKAKAQSGSQTGSKQGGPNANEKSDLLYRLHTNSHTMTYAGAWTIFSIMLVLVVVAIGLVGGVWGSISDDNKTNKFKDMCYALWGVLGGAALFAVIFIIYFRRNMDDLLEKGLHNINLAYGTTYKKNQNI